MNQYKLRLVSQRIVEPGPGGFYWYRKNGDGAGGIHHFEYIVAALARADYGAVGTTNIYGDQKSVTEVIPIVQVEAIIRIDETPRQEGPYR